jgi:tripartite-type tricarboxylate transporter receptor subunit TctC
MTVCAMKRLCLFITAIICATPTHAQEYPSKPVKFVVGFSAGGAGDIIARTVAQDLTAQMGQAFVVENRPGANAIIATEFVARSAPDGYTMLFSSLSLLVNAIIPGNNVKYDPFKDFAPVSNAAVLPMLVVTSPETKLQSMQDLIARAKAKPGALSYGTSGHASSTHLAGAMFELVSGTKMIDVPFKGNGLALGEVIAGRVTFMFYPAVGIADQVAHKRLKVLAVGTKQPWAEFPGVPTLEEAGLQGFDAMAPWAGLLAPSGTPPAIVNRVSAEMRRSLAKPETQARMKQLGAIIVADTPAQYAAFLKKDYERWAQVIKTSGVKAE